MSERPSSAPIVSDAAEAPAPAPLPPERYERRQLVGVGGMGRVSVAWDRALGREVALKEPAPGHEAALLEEARRAAALDHPGIVPVFDVGVGPDGVPWYTMRLLRGRPLEEALRAEPDLAGRLGWLRAALAACEAVAYAHARGVVHRDLTPANLLLGELGETCVADWGLAAATGARGTGGTPGYRAPEQEVGGAADARADVYALGAVLFRLCAGAPPGPGVALPAEVPPELAAIVARAMARAPDARYPDARALAGDLAAFLDGRRVSAHAYTAWELLRRLVAAWRAPLAVGAVAGLVLLATASRLHLDTVRERDRARLAEQEASTNLGRTLAAHAVRALRAGEVGEAAVLAAHAAARTPADDTSLDASTARAYAVGVLAAAAAAASPEPLGRAPLPPGCGEARLSGDALICLGGEGASAWGLDGASRGARPGHFVDAAWHPRGLVLLDGAGVLTVDGVPLAEVAPAQRFTLVGDTLLAVVATAPRTVDVATGAVTVWPEPCPVQRRLLAVAAHRDGRLAVVCSDGDVLVGVDGRFDRAAARVPDPATLAWLDEDLLVGTVHGDVVRVRLDGVSRWRTATSAAALQEVWGLGADVAWARGPRGTWLLDPATGALRTVLPSTRGAPLLASDGALHALVDGEPARIARRLPARWPATVLAADAGLSALAISPDGGTIAVGGGQVLLWDVATGGTTRVSLPEGVVKALAWAPDGGRVLGSESGPNDVFVLGQDGARLSPGSEARTLWRRLAWLADGLRVGLSYAELGPVVWDAHGERRVLGGPTRPLHDLGVAPDRTAAALLDEGGGAWWLGGNPTRLEPRGNLPDARAVDLGPGGELVVATDASLVVLDATGGEARRWSIAPREVLDVAWSPDGAWIATASLDGLADVWDAHTGALAATLAAHADRVAAVEFAPDGAWLVTASWDRTARRWSLAPLRGPPPDPAAVEARWGISLAETLATARW